MVLDEAFWVAIALFILIGLLWRPVGRAMAGILDGRSEKIGRELEEAVRLREEAQALLAAHQKKYRAMTDEAESILHQAREEAKTMQKQAQEVLKQALATRMEQAERRMDQEEQKALQEIQRQVVAVAVAAAAKILTEHLGEQADDHLIKLALNEIPRAIH